MTFYSYTLDLLTFWLYAGGFKAAIVLCTLPTHVWAMSRLRYGKGTKRIDWFGAVMAAVALTLWSLFTWPNALRIEGWRFFWFDHKYVIIREQMQIYELVEVTE